LENAGLLTSKYLKVENAGPNFWVKSEGGERRTGKCRIKFGVVIRWKMDNNNNNNSSFYTKFVDYILYRHVIFGTSNFQTPMARKTPAENGVDLWHRFLGSASLA